MAYTLQLLRSLIEAHPDRAAPLTRHVEALEVAIVTEPGRCLERVRALFESTCHTIAPQLGLAVGGDEEFPAQIARIIRALDFALDRHPEAERIGDAIRQLLGSMNGTIGALARLSNIPGLRHGGSLDWGTLQRQHALMLGGLCDSLVSFLFDVAWSRDQAAAEDVATYEDHASWNDALDDDFGAIRIGDGEFWASRILFTLDPNQYEALRRDWLTEAVDAEEQVAA